MDPVCGGFHAESCPAIKCKHLRCVFLPMFIILSNWNLTYSMFPTYIFHFKPRSSEKNWDCEGFQNLPNSPDATSATGLCSKVVSKPIGSTVAQPRGVTLYKSPSRWISSNARQISQRTHPVCSPNPKPSALVQGRWLHDREGGWWVMMVCIIIGAWVQHDSSTWPNHSGRPW